MPGRRTRKIVLAVCAAAGVLSLVAASAWLLIDRLDPFNDAPFTAIDWMNCRTDEARASMARDLVRNHLPKGMSEAEVVALLGEPGVLQGGTDTGGNRVLGTKTYFYYIGTWSLQGFDDAFVYVHLDSDSKVISAEVTGY